jgi:hypothetical protein
MWYITSDERTEFTKVRRPTLFSNLPFQLGTFPTTLSMNVCLSSYLIRSFAVEAQGTYMVDW